MAEVLNSLIANQAKRRLNRQGDTSQSSYLPLLALTPALLIGANALTPAPYQPRIYSETSQGSSRALLSSPTPTGSIHNLFLEVPRSKRINDDTSQGMPKTLGPFVVLTTGNWVRDPHWANRWKNKKPINDDTSQGSPSVLTSTVAGVPGVQQQVASAPMRENLRSETSQNTPRVMMPVEAATSGNWVRDPLHANSRKFRRFTNLNTSQGTWVGLFPPVTNFVPAFTSRVESAPPAPLDIRGETSQGSSTLLVLDYVTVATAQLEILPVPLYRQVYLDTSVSAPAVLVQIPPPQSQIGGWLSPEVPKTHKIYSETSQGTSLALQFPTQAALPGAQATRSAPPPKRILSDTTQSSPFALIHTEPILNLTVGQWTWSGVPFGLGSTINLVPGLWEWSGTTMELTQLLHTTPGQVVWSGVPFTLEGGAQYFTYQNNNGWEMDIIIQGGAVLKIEFSRNGTTWYDVGVVAGMFHLSEGDWCQVTWTSPPTISGVPR